MVVVMGVNRWWRKVVVVVMGWGTVGGDGGQ